MLYLLFFSGIFGVGLRQIFSLASRDFSGVERPMRAGADPDRPDPSDGLTPLQAACTVGHTGAVRALLEAKVCMHDAGIACMHA